MSPPPSLSLSQACSGLWAIAQACSLPLPSSPPCAGVADYDTVLSHSKRKETCSAHRRSRTTSIMLQLSEVLLARTLVLVIRGCPEPANRGTTCAWRAPEAAPRQCRSCSSTAPCTYLGVSPSAWTPGASPLPAPPAAGRASASSAAASCACAQIPLLLYVKSPGRRRRRQRRRRLVSTPFFWRPLWP